MVGRVGWGAAAVSEPPYRSLTLPASPPGKLADALDYGGVQSEVGMGTGTYSPMVGTIPGSGSSEYHPVEGGCEGVHSGDDTSRAVARRGRYTVKIVDGRTVRVKPENVKLAKDQPPFKLKVPPPPPMPPGGWPIQNGFIGQETFAQVYEHVTSSLEKGLREQGYEGQELQDMFDEALASRPTFG